MEDFVDGTRVIDDLKTLRKIGGVETGVVREAFTDADIEARRWLAARFAEAGLEPVWDEIGNLFGLPPGDEPAFLVGSHSDSQPTGGWLDGALGVVYGLEAARARAAGADMPPIAVISWQDEEGAFDSLTGSRVWTGELSREKVLGQKDRRGHLLRDEIARVPEIVEGTRVPAKRFSHYLEAHIEQGPVLDESGEAIGVVDTIVGMRLLSLSITGEQNHAGTTPMPRRRDAVQALVAFVTAVNERFSRLAGPATVWTVGRVEVVPNAVSIVPGRVRASLQMRDPDAARLDAMRDAAIALAAEMTDPKRVAFDAKPISSIEPVAMDAELVRRLEAAAEATAPGRWRRMVSGALHDAAPVSRVLPTAMLFVPSIGGISHSFAEDTREDDIVVGCRTLVRALMQ